MSLAVFGLPLDVINLLLSSLLERNTRITFYYTSINKLNVRNALPYSTGGNRNLFVII